MLRKALVIVAVALLPAARASAHESDGSSPAPDDGPTTEIVFPPIEPGVADANRVFVRTSSVNPTEFLKIRVAIIDAGFPDTLEVAPGSFIVEIGSRSFADAAAVLSEVPSVVEVVPAPAYASTKPPAEPLKWWLVLPLSLTAAAGVLVVFRPRRPTSEAAAAGSPAPMGPS